MDIKIFEKTDDEVRLEIGGEDHTLLNALRSILLQDERVKIASYDIKHPGISYPVLHIRTKDVDPIMALKDAATLLGKQCDTFKRKFKNKVK
ncbi:MAG: DNA-directed RNA polymerase subunit L [Methanosarcinales archaeon Met12]|nr:MAG: DNA-directed RNA polymerase subunit L [Methanosarcinales archaeon Met12]